MWESIQQFKAGEFLYTYRLYQPVPESRSDAGSFLRRPQSERPVIRVGGLSTESRRTRPHISTHQSFNQMEIIFVRNS